jgi:hypothetical protein
VLGCRQAVRHGSLEPALGGSNPPTPAIYGKPAQGRVWHDQSVKDFLLQFESDPCSEDVRSSEHGGEPGAGGSFQ